MQVAFSEAYRDAENGEEIRLGVATWDNGERTSMSVKFTWFDKNGRAARGALRLIAPDGPPTVRFPWRRCPRH